MKIRPSLLAPAVILFCPLLLAGPGDFAFSSPKMGLPSLSLLNQPALVPGTGTNPAFTFSGGPDSLLRSTPQIQLQSPPAFLRPYVTGASPENPDRMPILNPDPLVDYKLTLKNPDFHLDDGILDGRPDLRSAK